MAPTVSGATASAETRATPMASVASRSRERRVVSSASRVSGISQAASAASARYRNATAESGHALSHPVFGGDLDLPLFLWSRVVRALGESPTISMDAVYRSVSPPR